MCLILMFFIFEVMNFFVFLCGIVFLRILLIIIMVFFFMFLGFSFFLVWRLRMMSFEWLKGNFVMFFVMMFLSFVSFFFLFLWMLVKMSLFFYYWVM